MTTVVWDLGSGGIWVVDEDEDARATLDPGAPDVTLPRPGTPSMRGRWAMSDVNWGAIVGLGIALALVAWALWTIYQAFGR